MAAEYKCGFDKRVSEISYQTTVRWDCQNLDCSLRDYISFNKKDTGYNMTEQFNNLNSILNTSISAGLAYYCEYRKHIKGEAGIPKLGRIDRKNIG